MKEKYAPLAIALTLIAVAVSLRILPHPANFAPVGAISIFGGSILPKRLSVWVPLFAMMISDAVIGFYSLMPLIWACYLIIALASSHWLRPARLRRGIALTLGASCFFFVVTNFGVWATSGMYAHTWSGLVSCYTLAIPFFRNTLLSDAVYTSLLFTIYALAMYRLKLTQPTLTKKAAPVANT
jgi:hypothetical protein